MWKLLFRVEGFSGLGFQAFRIPWFKDLVHVPGQAWSYASGILLMSGIRLFIRRGSSISPFIAVSTWLFCCAWGMCVGPFGLNHCMDGSINARRCSNIFVQYLVSLESPPQELRQPQILDSVSHHPNP